ncbi:MAG: molybdate ABC transporter substrate-binding protein [Chloroflexi bacterium]|nr:molybdate ABC transporter substrate-binding protein [Chloroflexota bacterium]
MVLKQRPGGSVVNRLPAGRTALRRAGLPGLLLLILLMLAFPAGCAAEKQQTITVFSGSVARLAMEDAAGTFETKTGIKVYLNFSGSGTMLSQMKLSRSGDLYVPASPDYMRLAERDGVIEPGSEKRLAYLVPAILVQRGNPRNIQTLSDLAGPGIQVAIADPESVTIGLYAYEILVYNNLLPEVGGNIVTYGESYGKVVSLVALKIVDAAIGWSIAALWQPDTIEVVYLKPEQVPRLSYLSAAISTFARDRESSQRFLDFLASPEGQEIFRRRGYITAEGEARKFAPGAEIGGEYRLPESYRPVVK